MKTYRVVSNLMVMNLVVCLLSAIGCQGGRRVSTGVIQGPDERYTALFNGRDLQGWRGLGHFNPYKIAGMNEQQKSEKQAADNENMRQHWRVENGEIVNDGKGVFLTTENNYRDFDLLVDWRMVQANTDSGIYLRGLPQVQIWDPSNAKEVKNGADKGSGALWNNKGDGKWPLVKADKPVGEWNTFRVRMVGERVSVWFNGRMTVDNAPLENYWDRQKPVPLTGPIQLQTHGGEMRFRNVLIREIPAEEANKTLQSIGNKGFVSLFNGKNMDGWVGGVELYDVVNGCMTFKKEGGGNIFAKGQYGDFDLRFEFNLPPGGNSGIGIRTPLEGNPAYLGMEIQVLDDGHEMYKDIHAWQVHGSVYGVVAAHRGYLRPTGEWNYMEIVAKGPRIQVFVNGTKVNDADLDEAKPVDGSKHPGLHNADGYIGLLGHKDPVSFRNIRIKPL